MRAAMHPFDRIRTGKGFHRLRIAINPDRAQGRRLALHQRPATEVALDIDAQRPDILPIFTHPN